MTSSEPCFHATWNGQQSETSGAARVSLGNRSRTVFADWYWDGDTLTLTNDRYGHYPIYYWCKGNTFAVSPSIQTLLALGADRTFDDDAFAVFLRLGWLLAEDTVFRSIRAVPPGSVLSWCKGELTIASAGIIASKPLSLSRSAAIDAYAGLFQAAVENSLPADDEFIVPLSGGRDSRHILFALNQARRQPRGCVTIVHWPPRPNEDAKIAAHICDKLHLEHRLLPQNQSRFDAEIRKNDLTGYTVREHGWFLALADFLAPAPRTVFDGIAGDVLSQSKNLLPERLKLFQQGRLEELAEAILGEEGYLPHLLTKECYQAFSRARAVSHLANELARHQNQPNPVGSFYFWNRTRRAIAPSPFRLLGQAVEVVTPYLDVELFSFLTSLPAAMLVDHRFHDDTIAAAFPQYAQIPYEDSSARKNLDASHFRAWSRDIARYSLTRRNRPLTNRHFCLSRYLRSIVDRNYSSAVTHYGEQVISLLQLERIPT
jgi:asparagine synthase (glutamine-hydrolysing)